MKNKLWNSTQMLPKKNGWYITRTRDGFISWRAWENGAWWKQLRGGWIESYDGHGIAITYEWLPTSWHDIALNAGELPMIVPDT